MYSKLAENIIYPLSDVAIGTSVIRYYHWLKKTQWWSPDQLQQLQNNKLKGLIQHAYNNVPYYRLVFEERGLTDRDIQTVEDLVKLPILTKEDIRTNLGNLKANNFCQYHAISDTTGGSTGEPLKYYITKDVASINWAGMFRGWNWAGYMLGDKRISFGGSSLVPNKKPSIFQLTRQRLERNMPLSAVSMNDAKYAKYIDIIGVYLPRFIYGYPSSIFLFADYCKTNNINNLKFHAVFSTAEVLLPDHRTAIEEQFKCKVFDQYGSYDGGGQALECEVHHGFHITVEKAIMEIVNEQGHKLPTGKSGRIIVTDLHNYAMPFIRYEVGDMGILSDKACTCGRSLPKLKALEGRTTDIIKLSNGVSIAGPAVTLIFKDCHVKQYQLIQVAKDQLLVKIVKNKDYSDWDTNHFMSILKHHAGKEAKFELEFCEKIPVGNNNKYKFIISNNI